MFPGFDQVFANEQSFPRVSGDVSPVIDGVSFVVGFSPRERGCFQRFR